MIEAQLKSNLRTVRDAFMAKSKISETGLWRLVAQDNRFFSRVVESGKSFNVRSYDTIMQKFSDNWPEGAVWPESVGPRPSPTVAAQDQVAA